MWELINKTPVFPGCQLALTRKEISKRERKKVRKQIWFLMKENFSPALRHSYPILLAANKYKSNATATASKATTVIH